MNRIIVLEDQFDPNDLPPGYYTAYSDTAAYPTLWSMVNVGMAHDEGVRYLDGGVVQMLASYDMPPLERNPEYEDDYEEAMIIIPHSAYTKVTNDYGNWEQMWWREVIQNAVDAGATKIDCRIQEQEDGTWLASCQDNGGGMSQDTMMNAFFTVGGTEKPDYAHGGFGEAKKLIALAWIEFSVHSRDLLVRGSGAEFPKLKLYRNAGIINGTKVEVVMPADKHTTEAAAIEYISRCQLPGIKFFVNGNPARASLRRGRKKRDLPKGAELFYNEKAEGIHGLLVRSNGLYMFDRELSSDFRGILVVELHPKPEAQGGPTVEELLVSNRMSLQPGRLSEAVNRVYSQAEFDLKQAMRDPDALFRKRYEGRGFFSSETARNREAIVREAAGPLPEIEGGFGLEMTPEMLEQLVELFKEFEATSTEEAAGDMTRLISVLSAEEAEIMLGAPFKGESHLESSIRQMVWQPDFININDETTRDRFKLDKKFEPEFMTGPVYAIARLWAAFVRFVLIKQGSNEVWGVGFVFSKDAQGMFYQDDKGLQWVCLNPINLSTNKLMSIRDKADVRLIFEVAMHECSHLLGGSYHGDAFVRAFDGIVQDMLQHWGEAKRIAKNIKVRGIVKKLPKSKTPEMTELIVTPIAYRLAQFVVHDDASRQALMKDLGLDWRDLEFYLFDNELEDRFLMKAQEDPYDNFNKGLVFSTKMSYPWVRRELLRVSEPLDEQYRVPHEIPVRVSIMYDGAIYFEPDNKLDRKWFRKYRGNLTDASLRIPFVDTPEFAGQHAEAVIEKLFFENELLTLWPYSEKTGGPGEYVKELFRDGTVVIPFYSWLYGKVLESAATDHPPWLISGVEDIALNVSRGRDGLYHVHPEHEWMYEFYQWRFDAWPALDLVLDKKRDIDQHERKESKQLEEYFADWTLRDLEEGRYTTVHVPIDLFERWMFNNEFLVRTTEYPPKVPDEVLKMAENTAFVIARNLGMNMMAFEFSGPSYQGEAIVRRYKGYGVNGMSELTLFVPADQIHDVIYAIKDEEEGNLLRKFWKACAPGMFALRLPVSLFIQGLDPQFKLASFEPRVMCPVWLHVANGRLYIKPVLQSQARWFSLQGYPEGTAVISDMNRAETIARQIIQATYNCGATPTGLENAETEFDRMIAEQRPVLATVLPSDLIKLIQEPS